MDHIFNSNNTGWIVVGFVVIGGVLAHLITSWFRYRKAEIDATLKEQMIQRGMSADEIVRVLQASSNPPANAEQPPSATPAQTAEWRGG